METNQSVQTTFLSVVVEKSVTSAPLPSMVLLITEHLKSLENELVGTKVESIQKHVVCKLSGETRLLWHGQTFRSFSIDHQKWISVARVIKLSFKSHISPHKVRMKLMQIYLSHCTCFPFLNLLYQMLGFSPFHAANFTWWKQKNMKLSCTAVKTKEDLVISYSKLYKLTDWNFLSGYRHVSPCAVKLQKALKASLWQPWLGSIQYSPGEAKKQTNVHKDTNVLDM